jgi:hypothetical protein
MISDPYNALLFEGNVFRRFLHERRFWWLAARIQSAGIRRARIVEIGCHDAKTIRYLERSGIIVDRYIGYEAHENVIAAAQREWSQRPEITIRGASWSADMQVRDESLNVGICMETFEHLSDDLVDGYLSVLAENVRGPVFITVPVERGAMLLAKQFGYRLFDMYGERLGWRDILNGTLGRTHMIGRHEHRGFDDRRMLDQIRKHFDVVESAGLFVPYLTTFNFSLGIIGMPKPQ